MQMGNTAKNKVLMAIKRYTPKYKKLNKLRQAFWFEKKGKIKKFRKQKWAGIKRFYYPKRYKFFNQDKSAYFLSRSLDDEKSIRMKKTYKFLLRDKQKLQLFYGAGRLRTYQLRQLTKKAMRISQNTAVSPAKVMLSLMENRTQNLLYRLGFVSSLMEARRFIHSDHIQISNEVVKNCVYTLGKLDSLKVDPARLHEIVAHYLKQNALVFHFKQKKLRRKFLFRKQQAFANSIILNNTFNLYDNFKVTVLGLKNKKN